MPELSYVYGLIMQAAAVGAGSAAAVWIMGYAISSIYNLIRRG